MANESIRELSNEELAAVSGGDSLTIGIPLGGLPPLSLTFHGNEGILSFNGLSIPVGLGHPPIHLP